MKYIDIDNNLRASYSFAVEEYIIKNELFTDDYFLFWRNVPTLMLGRFQNYMQEINMQFVNDNNIQVVRRNSGGGTIYTDLETWQFSFITHKDNEKLKDFRDFTKPIIDALQQLGVKATFSGRNDLMIDNKKFSGNAQFAYKNKFLHHGSILFNTNIENMVKSLNVNKDKLIANGVKSVKERVANLKDYLNEDLSSIEFKDKMINLVGSQWDSISLSEKDKIEIEKIENDKFQTWNWNFGNNPKFNISNKKKFKGGSVEVNLEVDKGIIKQCLINGDFFCKQEDLLILQNNLSGCKYIKQDIEIILKQNNITSLFYDISLSELLSCFIED